MELVAEEWVSPESQEEQEEALAEPLAAEQLSEAVVTDTDWTTETILSQMRRKNIMLNPRFQRRDAWDRSRKSRFIESLVLGLPIPQLVLAEDKRRKGAFIVLDGKQRLLTLAQFAIGSSLDVGDGSDARVLKLSGLEVRDDLETASLKSLEEDLLRIDDLNSFLNETIRTVVVRNWPTDDFLNLVFLRLNAGSVALSPQELRQALHPGEFTDFLDDFSSASEPLKKMLKLKKPDFRMRDVEVLLRYFAMKTLLEEYRGNLKKVLDDTSARLNSEWEQRRDEINDLAEQFDAALTLTQSVFQERAFKRWNSTKKSYERSFNRAVFDIMTYYLSLPEVREKVEENPQLLERKFRELSESDSAFDEALQTSTKTIEAVHRRLSTWGTVIGEAYGLSLDIPRLDAERVIRVR